jgi:hypothetical protein
MLYFYRVCLITSFDMKFLITRSLILKIVDYENTIKSKNRFKENRSG